MQLPERCPLQGLDCSQMPNALSISSVAWKGTGLQFQYNTSMLETGIDACNMMQQETVPDGLLPLIVSAVTDNGTSHFWILVSKHYLNVSILFEHHNSKECYCVDLETNRSSHECQQ